MGGEDGVPKTPKWAEKICGVPSYTIKALARYWAKHAVSIAHCNGGSFIRSCFAHEPARLEVALLGMQGVGKPGANQFKFMEWTLFGIPTLDPLPPSTHIPSLGAAYRGYVTGTKASFIPKTMIPEAIMNPTVQWYGHISAGLPREDQFDGPYTFPPEGGSRIHMIWSDSPCWETCWNGGFKMQDALRHESIEFVVVQHPWMENDTMFADVILPTNTKFETEDIGTDCDNGQWNVVFYERQAIKPIGESKSDKEAVGEVAKALEKFGGAYEGIYDKYVGGKTDEEWIKVGFDTSGVPRRPVLRRVQGKAVLPVPHARGLEGNPGRHFRLLRRSGSPSAAHAFRQAGDTTRPRWPRDSPRTRNAAPSRTGWTKAPGIRSASTWSAAASTRSCWCRTTRTSACTRSTTT